nr:MAG TPA: hypothetical protein [Caudoviricetes sp.]
MPIKFSFLRNSLFHELFTKKGATRSGFSRFKHF